MRATQLAASAADVYRQLLGTYSNLQTLLRRHNTIIQPNKDVPGSKTLPAASEIAKNIKLIQWVLHS